MISLSGERSVVPFPGINLLWNRRNMNNKKYNIMMISGLMVLDLYYVITSMKAPAIQMTIISPYYFPKILGFALLGLCVIQLFLTVFTKTGEGAVEFHNLPLMVGTIIATALLLFLWGRFGFFYFFSFLYLASLLFMYRDEHRFSKRNIIINIGFALALDLAVFLLFTVLLKVKM